jgi:N-acetylmuramoyl-L-alanine amidase
MLPIKQMILTNKNRPGIKLKKLKGIAMHWTANENNGADAVANRNYFNSTTTAASAHYIVDEHQIIQCVPDDEVAWHVGAKRYTEMGMRIAEMPHGPNYYLIGVEMCVNRDGDWNKTYRNSVELAAHLLKKHNLTIQDLYRHYDITGKDCPRMMVNAIQWLMFKQDVAKLLSGTNYFEQPKKGALIASTLSCKAEPSNNAKTNGTLRKGVHDPLTIYAECQSEGIKWYLVNKVIDQWVAAHYIQIV